MDKSRASLYHRDFIQRALEGRGEGSEAMGHTAASTEKLARDVHERTIAHRRELHRIPELAFDEEKTHAYIWQVLQGLGLRCRRLAKTGVVADLIVDPGAPLLAFRADMDALPVPEETGLPFASQHPGRMHACGHDAHMAMVLGAAEALAKSAASLRRNVRFLFQPSEEMPPGGAKSLIAEGALESVGTIYGFHVAPWLPSGLVATCEGPISAAADGFAVTVRGKGGHAAFPHLCVDPIPGTAAMIGSLQALVSRALGPLESGVLSVTTLQAGHAFNVIPDEVRFTGTIRAFTEGIRQRLAQGLVRIVEQTALAHGLTAQWEYTQGYAPTVNHAPAIHRLQEAMAGVGAPDLFDVTTDPMLGGEDFCYYLERIPGAFLFLGVRDANADTGAGLHHCRFTADESVLWRGVATYLALALR